MTDYAMVTPAPGGPDSFERRPWDPGRPGPGEVLLRHTAIGLNFIDIYHRSGFYPWPVERDLVVGSEAAGVIEAVGEGVPGLSVGDRVAYTLPMGAYVSARVVPADRLVPIPDAISDEVAATLMLKGLTAHYLIHDCIALRPGMHVLVHAAAGGVGSLLGQWLTAKGAVAIGTAGGPAKVALAREHGYAHVIDYRTEDFPAVVAEITDGRGVGAVLDGVAGTTWRGSLAALGVRGAYVCFGQAAGPVTGFALSDLAGKSLSAARPVLFHYIAEPAELRARARDLFAAVAAGEIRSHPRQRVALAEVAQAHAALEGRATTGATVLIP